MQFKNKILQYFWINVFNEIPIDKKDFLNSINLSRVSFWSRTISNNFSSFQKKFEWTCEVFVNYFCDKTSQDIIEKHLNWLFKNYEKISLNYYSKIEKKTRELLNEKCN